VSVVVIGGGIIGLCIAHAANRVGLKVTLVERRTCGAGASGGNAGWITPAFSAPLPAPGVLRQTVGWLLRGDSPVKLPRRWNSDLLSWSWRFARSCSCGAWRAGMTAVLELNAKTMELYEDLVNEGIECEMKEDGIFFLARDERVLADEYETLIELKSAGYGEAFDWLSHSALRERFPMVGANVVGGIYASHERHVRPEILIRSLSAAVRRNGCQLLEDTRVERLQPTGSGWLVHTSKGPVTAERVVVAAGAWSSGILASLDVRLPMQAARGYSLTFPRGQLAPGSPLYFLEDRVAYTPFGSSVRFAGLLDLTDPDKESDENRVKVLRKSVSRYLDFPSGAPGTIWSGPRPLTPDGLPYIGALEEWDNLFVASGHAMVGMTLGPATALAIVHEMMGTQSPLLDPFRPDRFSNSRDYSEPHAVPPVPGPLV
jgi:D-amino-acid dehydrogenase